MSTKTFYRHITKREWMFSHAEAMSWIRINGFEADYKNAKKAADRRIRRAA